MRETGRRGRRREKGMTKIRSMEEIFEEEEGEVLRKKIERGDRKEKKKI